jgi:hypothetical protein
MEEEVVEEDTRGWQEVQWHMIAEVGRKALLKRGSNNIHLQIALM